MQGTINQMSLCFIFWKSRFEFRPWFQTSLLARTAFFCVVMQRVVIIPYRRFGTTYWSLKSLIFADVFVILISPYKRIPWRIGLLEMLMVPQMTIKPEVCCHFRSFMLGVSEWIFKKKATTASLNLESTYTLQLTCNLMLHM